MLRQNLSSLCKVDAEEKIEKLHEIGLPGNGMEVIVGKDEEHKLGFVEWGYYDNTDTHRVEFTNNGMCVTVRVPMNCDVRIEKYVTI